MRNCRMTARFLSVFLSVLLAAPLTAQEHALAIARDVERIAASRSFWPGFEPLTIPLAIYDGKRTWLLRHPDPPRDFAPSAISSVRVHVREGRHPAVTSNSSADIGGITTATLLADGARAKLSSAELAATALHESFHVFQRTRHPGWQGNEGDLLLYPVENAELLVARRLESEALRRALLATDPGRTACYARLAADYRAKRFMAMDSAFVAYERGTELNEGLATYIQQLALGRTTVDVPPNEFAAADVRLRIYTVGPAIAFLLDRIRPNWKASLEAHDRQALDEVLAGALVGAVESPMDGCALPPTDVRRIEETARRDAADVVSRRTTRRKAFDARPGRRVVITAATGKPLWPQGFDPLNIERMDGGLLHTRFLALGNEVCKATAIDEDGIDIDAFTDGFGPHPLFNGVRRAVVAGVEKPVVTIDGTRVTIQSSGIHLECSAATVEETAQEIRVSPH